jgi:hypothetical protein
MKAIIAVPVTLAMVYRALSHKSLTPAGCVAALLTAIVHAVHPWNLPFALLIVFYLAGSRVTKVGKNIFYNIFSVIAHLLKCYRSSMMRKQSSLYMPLAAQAEKAPGHIFKASHHLPSFFLIYTNY